MERGVIKSFEKERGFGFIVCEDGLNLEFYANSVVSRDRPALKPNDVVFYDIQIANHHRSAINIRKCGVL